MAPITPLGKLPRLPLEPGLLQLPSEPREKLAFPYPRLGES